MPLQKPEELFLYELSDMLSAERMIVPMLAKLAQEAVNVELRAAYGKHEQETKEQIRNIEQCFQALGRQPEAVTCSAVAGIGQEREDALRLKPAEPILEVLDLGGACKTEYYEIAAYKGLVSKAKLMGQSQVQNLLQQNLQQEEQMAQTLERLGKGIEQELIQGAAV